RRHGHLVAADAQAEVGGCQPRDRAALAIDHPHDDAVDADGDLVAEPPRGWRGLGPRPGKSDTRHEQHGERRNDRNRAPHRWDPPGAPVYCRETMRRMRRAAAPAVGALLWTLAGGAAPARAQGHLQYFGYQGGADNAADLTATFSYTNFAKT